MKTIKLTNSQHRALIIILEGFYNNIKDKKDKIHTKSIKSKTKELLNDIKKY